MFFYQSVFTEKNTPFKETIGNEYLYARKLNVIAEQRIQIRTMNNLFRHKTLNQHQHTFQHSFMYLHSKMFAFWLMSFAVTILVVKCENVSNSTETYPDDGGIVFVNTDMKPERRSIVIRVFQDAYRSGLTGYEKNVYLREMLERSIGGSWNVFCAYEEGFYCAYHYYPGGRAIIQHDGKYWAVFNL